MNNPPRPIKALGEVVLRARNLEAMREFYEKTVGLEVLERYENMVFFQIAPDYAGHTQILGVFAESGSADHHSLTYAGLDHAKSPLHHFALTLSLSDFEAEKERLRKLGLELDTAEHPWTHWRSLYFPDPEGNVVEFVCYDASV